MRDHVEAAIGLLCAHYLFPEKARRASALIRERQAAGHFDGLTEAELAGRLTALLFEVCADHHLRVRQRPVPTQGGVAGEHAWRERLRAANYGIERVERLAGNVGHLVLTLMPTAPDGGRAIAAAMELVSSTEALIIDLRPNRGGSPAGVILWCSYFFKDDTTHLNNIYDAKTQQTRQYWSLAWLPGERYLDKPVYLLTGRATFSGGEEFCYNLRAHRRAVLIGQATRGGAHPAEAFPLGDTLEMTVPVARSVNPVTGTNWEGTGVQPDIEVLEQEAFAVAYARALDDVIAGTASPLVRQQAQTTRSGLV